MSTVRRQYCSIFTMNEAGRIWTISRDIDVLVKPVLMSFFILYRSYCCLCCLLLGPIGHQYGSTKYTTMGVPSTPLWEYQVRRYTHGYTTAVRLVHVLQHLQVLSSTRSTLSTASTYLVLASTATQACTCTCKFKFRSWGGFDGFDGALDSTCTCSTYSYSNNMYMYVHVLVHIQL